MAYASLRDCVLDLERHGQLLRVTEEIDPDLEAAEVQRRAYAAGAPALLLENVRGSRFPCLANLFGTMERCRFIFRRTLRRVERIVRLKADPAELWRAPLTGLTTPLACLRALPIRRPGRAPSFERELRLSDLPPIRCWPEDGGPFITLPQVLTSDPSRPRILGTNLGMYRIQLAGNRYRPEREVGLHYQIQRGIGVHHAEAVRRGERLPVSVFVGGPPAHTLAAILPLPEGLSELLFAGLLAGRNFRWRRHGKHVVSCDADFVLLGSVDPRRTLPEGPFGDHFGYYSLAHEYPVLEVEQVRCRRDAIWPFTVVGRPPQEDTSFGALIHEIVGPLVPREIPGVHAVHAVDAAGVHPLLLAVGSERYVPWEERKPRELLTQANAVLGFGQCSLAKWLFIAAVEDDANLDPRGVERFLRHVLERVDWTRDIHFQTRTTIDTLDYSGTALNEGSKAVVAAAGPVRRTLARRAPKLGLPAGFGGARVPFPGLLVLGGPPFERHDGADSGLEALVAALEAAPELEGLPLVALVDDPEFAAARLENLLWVVFTRSNPSHDVHGAGAFIEHKHWGCRGPLLVDARLKPHHAPPLLEDPATSRRVDELCGPGKSLHGVL